MLTLDQLGISEDDWNQILGGRGQAEAREVIGRGFIGIVNTDRYAGYHWVDAHRRQLCWAHLKREFEAIKQRGVGLN